MPILKICTNCESGAAHLHPLDFFCIRNHCNCEICRATRFINMPLDKKIQKVLDIDVNKALNKPIKFVKKSNANSNIEKKSE